MEHEEFIGMILSGDALTWERMIYEIVEKENLNPWDINVSFLAEEFSNRIKNLKRLDFKLSGKVILAASVLLRMKSDRLELDEILGRKKRERSKVEEIPNFNYDEFTIEPNVPFPRDRRVTLPELMDALRKAIEVDVRRDLRRIDAPISKHEIEVKKSKYNIKDKMIEVLNRVKDFFKKFNRKELLFEELLPSKKKEDVVWTFMPLMFLANNGKVKLKQEELFGPLYVEVNEDERFN